MTPNTLSLITRLQKILSENAQRRNVLHSQFLETQHNTLQHLSELINLQITAVDGSPDSHIEAPKQNLPVLFDRTQLEEFATRSMAKCFGPEFLIYEGRRHPRIPNGDLLLMSRILEIDGQRHHFDRPSSIVCEYDVPQEAWYFRSQENMSLPYSVWMEIALQPCGFLSAYLGTSLMYPEMDYFFRNLDGNSRVLRKIDMRGKTITTHARLLSTVASGSTIIQKFEFTCSCQDEPVFSGESIFGFFPPQTMANQVGLDGGKKVLPAYETEGKGLAGNWIDLTDPDQSSLFFNQKPDRPDYNLAGGQLNYLDRVFISADANAGKPGYIFAVKDNNPHSWFYSCHFFEDPVMPGSLGVEAICEAMQLYALQHDLGRQFHSPQFGLSSDLALTWKYRGQIQPGTRQMKIEVDINDVIIHPDQVIIEGNASLWADTIRIYELQHIAICLTEGA